MTKQESNSQVADIPVPDPTTLTTQQMLRETENLRSLFEARLLCMKEHIDTLQKVVDQGPAVITEAVSRLQELQDEKFSSISLQFIERDKRTDQLSLADKTAVAAALQAAKEAVGAQQTSNYASSDKSDKATSKQIDSIIELFTTTTKASSDKIDDLRSRIGTIESNKKGSSEGIGMIGSVIVGVCTVTAVLVSLAAFGLAMAQVWKQ